ncbi:MAG TPA: serine hydrolase domain-containing protein [Caulobacteraceae bacterium]|nr:serine hydrolase domain-containing protein [Caulobacteraceae bacterium]
MAKSLQDVLQQGVEAGHAPGFAAAALTPQGEVLSAAAGARGVDNPAPMTPDTVFWIASMTKALTSVAAMQLVERGLLDLDAPVGERLPALAAPKVLTGFDSAGAPVTRPATKPITLRTLLTHTSGLGYDFCSAELARFVDATGVSVFGPGAPDIPLLFEPGEAWQYGISTDWVGQLVEAVGGKGLDAWFEAEITGPLGMTDTTFAPGEAMAGRRASVHQRLDDGSLVPIPFAMPAPPYFSMGGGGLYSTAGDYLKFLQAILAGGGGVLRPDTVARMTANQVGELACGTLTSARPAKSRDFEVMPGVPKGWGLGFLINAAPAAEGRAAGSLAWAGLGNCYYWADPKSGAAGVLLSQVMPFADPQVLETFAAMERFIYGV